MSRSRAGIPWYRVTAAAIGITAACSVGLAAQDSRAVSGVTLRAGYGGGGPSGIVVKAVALSVPVLSHLGVDLELQGLDHGNGPCAASSPSRCSGGARAVLLGMQVYPWGAGVTRVAVGIRGGAHRLSRIRSASETVVEEATRPMIAAAMEGQVRVVGPAFLQAGFQAASVFSDTEYRDVIGERLWYGVATIGLGIGLDLRR